MLEPELKWTKKERKEVEAKVLNLRDDQIGALLNLVGLNFFRDAIYEAIAEIRRHGADSVHLDILLTEADSKENLLWWVDFFHKSNSGAHIRT
jgi:hypothetical protein